MFKISINEKQFADAIENEAKKAKVQKETAAKQSVSTDEKSQTAAKQEKPKTREELVDRLNELDGLAREEYEKGENGRYSFKYATTDDTTDEQIGEKATSEAEEKYKKLADDAQQESENKRSQLENSVKNVEQTASTENAATEAAYEKAKEDAGNQALKRGMGRSSTIMELLKEYDVQKLNKIETRNAQAANQIKEINAQIDGLSDELQKSLKKLDMEKAIEINDRIEELKKQRDEKNAEVLKYNNEVSEKVAKYNEDLMQAANALGEKTYIQRAKEYKDKMAYAIIDYYSGLTKEEAIADFASSDFADMLDSDGLSIVKNYLKSRA